QAAAGLFGGRAATVVASNYQLKGVVAAADGSDSVAILSANGKPAQSVRQGAEIAPGAVVKEVHRGYVVVSEGGVPKRVELPETAPKSAALTNPVAPARPNPPGQPTQPLVPTQSGISYGAATPIQQIPAQPPAQPPAAPAR
ncbi:MAG: type II secretion system protein N, partial [Burkholderiaceae bacterium]